MKTIQLIFLIIVTWLSFSCNNVHKGENKSANTIDTSLSQATNSFVSLDSAKKSGKNYNELLQKKTTPNQKSNSNIKLQSENTNTLDDLFKKLDKIPQVFIFTGLKDTTFICDEGTKITIKAKTFVSEKTGKEITKKINFYIKEYYKLSDILLANLTTTSGNKILETGGMINISASSNNENCILKKGQSIEISFPTNKHKEEMHLFSGKWNNKNIIDWSLLSIKENKEITENYSNNNILDYYIIEEKPEFKGGEQAMMNWISKNTKYPVIAKEAGISGRVLLGFVIDTNGKTTDIKILKGVDPSLNNEAIRVVSSMPAWKPAKHNGKNVRVNFQIPISFSLGGEGYNTNDIEYAKEFENKMKNGITNGTELNEITRYVFSTSNLGWINCDRFYKSTSPKINYLVQTKGNRSLTDIKLVFHSIKSILCGSSLNNIFRFENVPIYEDVTIIALKYESKTPYIAVKTTKINNNGENELIFKPVTIESLKSEMRKLDNIN